MQLKLGIMQGRLLPKIDGRYQCFPAFNWQKEFYLAKKLSLKKILYIENSVKKIVDNSYLKATKAKYPTKKDLYINV